MFTTLYYSIFPVLGDFFGKLSAIATCNADVILGAVKSKYGLQLPYVNLFTGVSSNFTVFNVSVGSAFVRSFLILPAETSRLVLRLFGVSEILPVWLCLLIFTGVVATCMTLIRLVGKVFN
jgi:hypothetical protein